MNKKVLMFALLLAASGMILTGCGNKKQNVAPTSTESADEMQQDDMKSPEDAIKDVMDSDSDEDSDDMKKQKATSEDSEDADTTSDSNDSEEVASEAQTFEIASGTTATYTVQKKWLNKPTEAVSGTTSSVSGSADYDAANNVLSNVVVTINPKNFASGSSGRDNHVAGLFTGDMKIMSKGAISGVEGAFTKTIPLELEINGVKHMVDFDVTGTATSGKLDATGTGKITLSQYKIEAPSILNVYSVDDALDISFKLVTTTK